MTLTFEPLDAPLGAVVRGFPDDLTQLTATERAELLTAFDAYGLLLFRGREISLDEQHSVVASLGRPLDEACKGELHSYLSTTIDSLKSNGSKLHFHADYTTCPRPLAGISLYAAELPDGQSSTVFANSRKAWAELDPSVQERVSDLTATHCHPLTKQQYERPIREQEDKSEVNRRSSHPVRFTHPRTGEPILFTNDLYLEAIDGMGDAESSALITELNAWIRQPQFRYRHLWETHDLVVFDNLVMQHARDEDLSRGTRTLRRVIFTQPEWHETAQEWFRELVSVRGF